MLRCSYAGLEIEDSFETLRDSLKTHFDEFYTRGILHTLSLEEDNTFALSLEDNTFILSLEDNTFILSLSKGTQIVLR